ncbi:MAG: ubiquitin-like small modifier protein 1 [Halapricum sp.]
MTDRAVVLVCGGTATRFAAGDKVLASVFEQPLVKHVADRVAALADELVVNCRPEQEPELRDALAAHPAEIAVDDRPGAGPLAGINRGLAASEAEYAVVVACDMPLVDPAFVELLFDRVQNREAAIPRQESGWYQPLQAAYAVEPMQVATDRALKQGVDRPIEPALDLDYVVVEATEYEQRGTFFDVNTVHDLETGAERYADIFIAGPTENPGVNVTLRLFATFREAVGQKTVERELPEGSTIETLLRHIEADHEELGGRLVENGEITSEVSVLKNGREVLHLDGIETPLQDGDTVSIFPPVAGG